MTKEERVKLKKERALRRIEKRQAKDRLYLSVANSYERYSISWGRRKYQGKINHCEMGYRECELNGCNGDC